MGRLSVRRPVVRIGPGGAKRALDTLAAEEPLELRVDGKPLSVTMRTPGHDVELAHGFLLTEGVLGSASDVVTARYCDSFDGRPGEDRGRNTYNVLDVALAPGVEPPDASLERNFYTTSSCGVCGKASLDAVRLKTRFSPAADPLAVTPAVLSTLPDALRGAQKLFDSTGGLHGAGLFTADGELLVAREDVGRHNAVDKVLGWALLKDRVPAAGTVLMVSGRASFELVQKAVMAGVPLLSAVSAPSSLAVELAQDAGVTLVGFLRGETMNVYSHDARVT
ncbi:formate dehydrogenase accessory sulfurtransferase FdhD [Pseudonocardia sp. KRD-184]|uniref:Sulfur carrier protein FdhD n=1 Tax=Pseudonocardia oceani TaxID=2792013 RepID=A0ABS6UIV2_9PSEU|nr:formate dehydrogenase accessory sulfurtransferase FdhD [Pseudonocardia oceani]MBW0090833.1 formate dehydrogenase accessory sulfurtransferase FdhD [Pseudonocardia oceani]MBW0097974.1 formate dehydrogenase accessory sulfurtransferase FdhD [Pseudonocardia oceani]MBW0110525.1 formate dehydrogenase accessory sulfurtransferase FdhD [Pseudonocardia oceani]MBW0121582.1 formate dehydrogenase accessory sulfurtransferase FdhD [Pseudonocardia oceani]MBW0132160.1 formate dehydrogenase accessory sulfurtr